MAPKTEIWASSWQGTALCEERKALALAVAEAVRNVYVARQNYEAAKSRKSPGVGRFFDRLMDARADERKVLLILREHIESHGCRV